MPSTVGDRKLRIERWISSTPILLHLCTLDIRGDQLWFQAPNTGPNRRPSESDLQRHLEPGEWRFEDHQFERHSSVWWFNVDDGGNMHLNGRMGLVCRYRECHLDLRNYRLEPGITRTTLEARKERERERSGYHGHQRMWYGK